MRSPERKLERRAGAGAVNKSGRHTLPSTLKVAHGEAIEGRKLDFYKSWLLLAKCVCVCAHAFVFAVVLNTKCYCESLDRHCYKTCPSTQRYSMHTLLKTYTHITHVWQRGTHIISSCSCLPSFWPVCVCVFVYFSPFTHNFWSLCHDATASQFAPKSER